MSELVAKIAKANNVLRRRLKRQVTDNEIAEMLNVHISIVRLAFDRTRYPISLDGVVTDKGCMALQDIIPGPDETMPERTVQKQLMKRELKELLQTLSEREVHVFEITFWTKWKYPSSVRK